MPHAVVLGWCQLVAGALDVRVSRHLAAPTPGTQAKVPSSVQLGKEAWICLVCFSREENSRCRATRGSKGQ